MKKRMISMLLVFAMVLPVFCLRALAWSGVGEGDGIAWELDENGVLTLSGEGEMEDHSPAGAGWGSWIAKNITGKTGYVIWEDDIKGIVVNSGITIIGDAAFAHCTKSREARIEEGVVEIGSHAFLDNKNMVRIYLPASLEVIRFMAFYYCDSLLDVYYAGTESMWNAVVIERDNEALLNATIHFAQEEPGEDPGEEPGEEPGQEPGEDPVDPEPPQPSRVLGDVNGDGAFDYQDALLTLRYSIALEELDEESFRAADVNGDGNVNYEDALKILRAAIGLETLEPPKENFFADPDLDPDTMDYENTYTQQHLAFIASSEYQDILLVPGGLATVLSDTYEEANLHIINGTWKFIENLKMAVGEGEIELVNDYELLAALVMQSTGSEENFLQSYEKYYFDAVLELVNGLNKQLKACKEEVGVFTGSAISKVEEITENLDQLLITLQTMEGISEKDAKTLFADAVSQVKEAFESEYIEDNEAVLSRVKDGLSIVMDVTKLTEKTISELMDTYILYKALSGASEEWNQVWSEIAQKARNSGDKVEKQLAVAIEKILKQTQAYQKDAEAALLSSGVNLAGQNLAEYAYAKGFEVFDDMMNQNLTIKAIRVGLTGGVELSDALTNMDQISYHGKMMAGYGHLSKIVFEIMRAKSDALVKTNTYTNALLFDMAFNIYRNTQLACIESAISYNQAIAEAEGTDPKVSSQKAMEASMLLPYKVEWQGYKCHGITKIQNNGGNVVGYNGNVYYFRIGDGSYSKSKVEARYDLSHVAKNDLVVRAADGSEKVLISTTASGSIWICNNRALYKKFDNKWYYVDLKNPEKEIYFSGGDIIGYDNQEDMLVVRSSEEMVSMVDTLGHSVSVLQKAHKNIAVKDGYFYYYTVAGKQDYTFCRYGFEEKQHETLGTIHMAQEYKTYSQIGTVTIAEEGLYIVAGYQGGIQRFFHKGSLYFIPFEGKMQVFADGEVCYYWNYLSREVLPDGTLGKQYLYYHTSADVTNFTIYQVADGDSVSRVDLQTGTVEVVDFPLSVENVPFIHDGQLLVYTGGPEPEVILSAEAAAAMGCGALGFRSDGSAAYHMTADRVGDDWYIMMVESVEDDDSSAGIYQGYAWNFIKLFRYTPKTGHWEEIYSCK